MALTNAQKQKDYRNRVIDRNISLANSNVKDVFSSFIKLSEEGKETFTLMVKRSRKKD